MSYVVEEGDEGEGEGEEGGEDDHILRWVVLGYVGQGEVGDEVHKRESEVPEEGCHVVLGLEHDLMVVLEDGPGVEYSVDLEIAYGGVSTMLRRTPARKTRNPSSL